jgi:hypothetical protein
MSDLAKARLRRVARFAVNYDEGNLRLLSEPV